MCGSEFGASRGWQRLASFVVVIAVFAAIGLLRLPLQAVLLPAIPISIGITFWLRRAQA